LTDALEIIELKLAMGIEENDLSSFDISDTLAISGSNSMYLSKSCERTFDL